MQKKKKEGMDYQSVVVGELIEYYHYCHVSFVSL